MSVSLSPYVNLSTSFSISLLRDSNDNKEVLVQTNLLWFVAWT